MVDRVVQRCRHGERLQSDVLQHISKQLLLHQDSLLVERPGLFMISNSSKKSSNSLIWLVNILIESASSLGLKKSTNQCARFLNTSIRSHVSVTQSWTPNCLINPVYSERFHHLATKCDFQTPQGTTWGDQQVAGGFQAGISYPTSLLNYFTSPFSNCIHWQMKKESKRYKFIIQCVNLPPI